MACYYTALQSRSHAFILERRMKLEEIKCELTYMPRQIMKDLCNMGVRFEESEYPRAINVIKKSGLPGCMLYKETLDPWGSSYTEVNY